MKVVLISVLSVVLISCGGKKEQVSPTGNYISGTLSNYDGRPVFLERLDPRTTKITDTIDVEEDGSFSLAPTVNEEGFYRVVVDQSNFCRLILAPGDTVKINADFTALERSYSVEQSDESDRVAWLSKLILDYGIKMDSLQKLLQKTQMTGDMVQMQNLYYAQQTMNMEVGKELNDFIEEDPSSLSSLSAVEKFDPNQDFEMYRKVEDAMKASKPNSIYAIELSKRLDKIRSIQIGNVPPDIILPNPNGDQVSLYSLRGKYVLIDFWASWCRPCRAENPNVVKAYKKYKDMGFEILGVSLDNSKKAWMSAIQQDELVWKHCSDLGGWNSAAAMLYQVQSIPATFLLDPEGKILDRNLRGDALDARLEELLAQK